MSAAAAASSAAAAAATTLVAALAGHHKAHCLVLLGLAAALPKAKLWVRARKTDGAEALSFPLLLPGSEAAPAALLRYDSKTSRDAALLRFQGKEVLGCKGVQARRAEDCLAPVLAKSKARLIVRNLEFGVGVEALREAVAREGGGAGRTDVLLPAPAPRPRPARRRPRPSSTRAWASWSTSRQPTPRARWRR